MTFGQENPAALSKNKAEIRKINVFDPTDVKVDLDPQLEHLEAPTPDGESAKAHLLQLKIESSKKYPRKTAAPEDAPKSVVYPPVVGPGFRLTQHYWEASDTAYAMKGGTPLDNTVAISNDGMLMAGFNTRLYAHDLNKDSMLFRPSSYLSTFSFSQFAVADGITTNSPFDPKLLYDPNADRFISVFVSGRNPQETKLVVAFSSTNHPSDPWNVYEIPGDPRSDSLWSDYPAMAITETELFLTINMIVPGVSWQLGFAGSIIWQINLQDGYDGAATINNVWWDNIQHGGKYVRNLNPIAGGTMPLGPNMYFLSNRNFSLQNDSIFLVEISGSLSDPTTTASVKLGLLDTDYGMPPNGRQEDTDPLDPTSGLQTNDARWLGGFLHDDEIQFVGNTIHFATGNAAIYHGKIQNVSGTPVYTGKIIYHDSIDYGYPNIAFTGTEDCNQQSIIVFDHSSSTEYAGISSVYHSDEGQYSNVVQIKRGENYVDNFLDSNPYERWGDYIGMQRLYDEPGKVWTAGFFGMSDKHSSIWVNQLGTPTPGKLIGVLDTIIENPNECLGSLAVEVTGGNPPYTYLWNGLELNAQSPPINICDDAYVLEVVDAASCKLYYSGQFVTTVPANSIFPNPFSDRLHLDFSVASDQKVDAILYDYNGRPVYNILQTEAKKGQNRLSFNPLSLASGYYIAVVRSGNKDLVRGTVVKID